MSNSTTPEAGFLGHATEAIPDFLGSGVAEVLFIPYAAVIESYDDYMSRTRKLFEKVGYRLSLIHACHDPIEAVSKAQTIVIGGGNSFQLLRCLYDASILQAVRERVTSGVPYIGWSAGANVACPTIETTNDMPVAWPPRSKALGLVPFQINPHFVGVNPPGFHGETRAQRIAEFTYLNPGVHVVGLPEGGMIRIEADRIQLLGCKTAVVFHNGVEPATYSSLQILEKMLY